jgi:hypothetical protein
MTGSTAPRDHTKVAMAPLTRVRRLFRMARHSEQNYELLTASPAKAARNFMGRGFESLRAHQSYPCRTMTFLIAPLHNGRWLATFGRWLANFVLDAFWPLLRVLACFNPLWPNLNFAVPQFALSYCERAKVNALPKTFSVELRTRKPLINHVWLRFRGG